MRPTFASSSVMPSDVSSLNEGSSVSANAVSSPTMSRKSSSLKPTDVSIVARPSVNSFAVAGSLSARLFNMSAWICAPVSFVFVDIAMYATVSVGRRCCNVSAGFAMRSSDGTLRAAERRVKIHPHDARFDELDRAGHRVAIFQITLEQFFRRRDFRIVEVMRCRRRNATSETAFEIFSSPCRRPRSFRVSRPRRR